MLTNQSITPFADLRLSAADAPARTESHVLPHPLPDLHFEPDLPGFVASSKKMRDLIGHLRRAARADLPALVLGETGTGKELVARALHALGPRASGPFISLNCAAIAPELLERELFGHRRGAFTGAYETRGGLFEAADGGVLFLDEIGEASPAFQSRLLRVLDEGAIRRVGETTLRPVDVRVIAATNRDLEREIAEGRFRRDLYFRLRGDELILPPLRQRKGEIPYFVCHALDQWSKRRDTNPSGISLDALEELKKRRWPGNVRELLHEVERAAQEAGDGIITSGMFAANAPAPQTRQASSNADEIQRIVEAVRRANGNRSEAARQLGISRVTLYRRIKRLGINEHLLD